MHKTDELQSILSVAFGIKLPRQIYNRSYVSVITTYVSRYFYYNHRASLVIRVVIPNAKNAPMCPRENGAINVSRQVRLYRTYSTISRVYVPATYDTDAEAES